MARKGPADAGELDRPVEGPADDLEIRAGPAAHRVRGRHRDLHHPPRHPVRGVLPGPGPRPPAVEAAGRGQSRRRRLRRRMPQGRGVAGRDRTGRKDRLGHRPEGRPSVRRPRGLGLDRQFHPVGLRHGRDLRLPGPRPARPRLRPQVRPSRGPGRETSGRRRRLQRGNRSLRRPRNDLSLRLPRRAVDRGRQGRGHPPCRGPWPGSGRDRLSPAGLGRVTAALLGLSDPHRSLRDLRTRGRACRPAAGRPARGRDLR